MFFLYEAAVSSLGLSEIAISLPSHQNPLLSKVHYLLRLGILHPHDLIAPINIDHLAGDATGAVACKKNPGLAEFFTRAGAS